MRQQNFQVYCAKLPETDENTTAKQKRACAIRNGICGYGVHKLYNLCMKFN